MLGYATAFSLTSVIKTMLEEQHQRPHLEGLFDLNRSCCNKTGFMPLHVAAANGLVNMCDFLVWLPGCPPDIKMQRSMRDPVSAGGTIASLQHMTPLQLMCHLGDKRLVQHLMRRRATLQWSWGPISSFQLPLNGYVSLIVARLVWRLAHTTVTRFLRRIDSCSNAIATDVLDIVGRWDAKKETHEMLVDDFMQALLPALSKSRHAPTRSNKFTATLVPQGLLHKLFTQKWWSFARYYFCMIRMLEVATISTLTLLVMDMKMTRDTSDSRSQRVLTIYPCMVMSLSCILMFENARSCYNYWLNTYNSVALVAHGRAGVFREAARVFAWARRSNTHHVLAGTLCGAIPCARLVHYRLNGNEPTVDLDELWPPLAFAIFFFTNALLKMAYAPFETLGVLLRTTESMLSNDVAVYMVGLISVNCTQQH